MSTEHLTLYILGDTPPGDPLDCVAAATPYLAKAFAGVHKVGPGQAMSYRAMRRSYEPGVDRLLYDFTAHDDYGWALGALDEAPAAVLTAGHSPVTAHGAMTGLRSAQRYATGGFQFPHGVTIGVLEGSTGALAGWALRRPAVKVVPAGAGADLVISVAQGAIEAAYAALIALKALARTQPPIVVDIVATTRRDANDLADILTAFDLQGARVRYLRRRADIAAIVSGAGGLIDISLEATASQSDAAFVAHCTGLPVLSVTALDPAAEMVSKFTAASRPRNASAASAFIAGRSEEMFANELLVFIEAGHRRATLAEAGA